MKSILYVAGFENDREGFYQFLGLHLVGASVNVGQGLWEGKWELQATITAYGASQANIERLATLLCARYNQDAVLVEFAQEAYTINRQGVRHTLGRI